MKSRPSRLLGTKWAQNLLLTSFKRATYNPKIFSLIIYLDKNKGNLKIGGGIAASFASRGKSLNYRVQFIASCSAKTRRNGGDMYLRRDAQIESESRERKKQLNSLERCRKRLARDSEESRKRKVIIVFECAVQINSADITVDINRKWNKPMALCYLEGFLYTLVFLYKRFLFLFRIVWNEPTVHHSVIDIWPLTGK